MACSDIFSAAGTVIAIAPKAALPATSAQTATGWGAVTGWLTVGEISSVGEYGAEAALVTHKNLAGTVCKSKGSYNYGSVTVGMALVPEDTGQVLMRTAAGVAEKGTFPVRITFADATATLTVPTVEYFGAIFLSYKKSPGSDPDSIVMGSAQMELNTPVTSVARHAAAT
jgi:hypothetical protein